MEENKKENEVQKDNEKKKITEKKEQTKQEEVKKDEAKKASKEVEKKEDSKFKKVEENTKVEKKNNKKKHKLLKAILIIIGILVIAYFIFAMRNFCILNDILEKSRSYKNLTNYSYQVNINDEDVKIKYTYRVKDGITRTDMENLTIPSHSMIIWEDTNTNERIIAFTGVNTAIKTNVTDGLQVDGKMPFQFAENITGLSGLGLASLIYSENVQEKDCYVIALAPDYKIWIEKDTGLVVQQQDAKNSISEYVNIELNNVTEIYKPDLTGYEVTEQ